MHRVFCTDIPEPGNSVIPESREAEHLFKVFRARAGENVELMDGKGVLARGVIEKDKSITVLSRQQLPEPEMKLHLCCALPRKQKLDQLLKQAVELGAWSIRPVFCARSVASGGPRERWELLLREACKQSGNPYLPEVLPEEKLPAVLEKLQREDIKIYYGSVAPAETGGTAAAGKAVVIGPEGGFAPEEEEMMKKYNAEPLNLGPHVLRLETAAVCALAVLRRLGLVIAAGMVILSGCGDPGSESLLTRGKRLLESGDASGARDHFRKAVAVSPDDPEAFQALARVCDENLNEPLEAIYAYEMFLELLPEGADGRAEAEAALSGLRERAVTKWAGGSSMELLNLQAECEQLRIANSNLMRQLRKQLEDNNKLRQKIQRGR